MARKARAPERGPGRPALGRDKRSETIRIRVTAAFRARVDAAAKAAGMTTSDWGLGVLVAALSAGPGGPWSRTCGDIVPLDETSDPLKALELIEPDA